MALVSRDGRKRTFEGKNKENRQKMWNNKQVSKSTGQGQG